MEKKNNSYQMLPGKVQLKVLCVDENNSMSYYKRIALELYDVLYQ